MKKDKKNYDYMLEYNEMIQKIEEAGFIYDFNETLGEVCFCDKNDNLIGFYYDELTEKGNTSDYKLACKKVKIIFDGIIKF